MMRADDMTVLDDGTGLLKRLRRRKGWFAAVFVVVLGLVVLVLAALPRTYRANAQLIVASDETLVGSANQPQTQRAVGDPSDLESQTMLLRSPRLMSSILEKPAVQQALLTECEASRASSWTDAPRALLVQYLPDLFEEQKPCAEVLGDRQNALGRLDGGFAIGGVGRSRVLDVSFTSALPQTAAVVTNALVDAYLAEDRSRKVDTREEAIAWLNNEIRRSGDELRRAEIALENNRRQAGIVRGQQASISSERLSSLSQQLIEAQGARAQAASRIAQLSGGDSSREVLDSRIVSDLKAQIATVSAQYAQLAARYGDGYPQLAGLARQRNELQRRIDQESSRVVSSLQRDRDAANSRVADLTRQLEGAKIEVGDTTGAEAAIATLVRDVEVRREMFVDLSKKVNALETERRLIGGDARLVSYAEVPTKLWFPKKTPFLAMGIMVSAILAAAAALLRDRADRTVRGAISLAQVSGVPVLGHIPRLGRLPSPKQVEQPSALQESIRSLFAQCVLMNGTQPRVLLLTSSQAGEGKTFTTLALAHFAASTGRRVLALECDLRRPGFGASMRLPAGKPGLSEYLRGEVGFSDIVSSAPGKPDVIAAGTPAIDSLELLSNGRIDELLRYARSAYDLVVIDTPPSEMLMDARLLAKRADGVIYCASWGQSHSEAVLDGIRGMEQAGGRVLGLTVGMVRENEFTLYDAGTSRPSRYLVAPDAA